MCKFNHRSRVISTPISFTYINFNLKKLLKEKSENPLKE